MNRAVKNIAACVLAFLSVCFAGPVFGYFFSEISFTNSVFSVIFFALLYKLLKEALDFYGMFSKPRDFFCPFLASCRERSERLMAATCVARDTSCESENLFSLLFSFAFTCALVFGRQLESDKGLFLGYREAAAIVIWGLVFLFITRLAWGKLISLTSAEPSCLSQDLRKSTTDSIKGMTGSIKSTPDLIKNTTDSKSKSTEARNFKKKPPLWLITFIFFFICYFIALLGVYPGFFNYDATDEWLMAASRNFSEHHPLFHVLLLGGFIQLFHKLSGSYNAAIAIYLTLQMTFLSGLYTFILNALYKELKSLKFYILFALYFAFFPVIQMLTLCSSKDTLVGALMMLFVFLMRKLFFHTDEFFSKKSYGLVFILTAILLILLRNNVIYGFALFAFFVLIFNRSISKKKTAILFLAPFLASVMINGVLSHALNASPARPYVTITVPIMQLTRTYEYHFDLLSDEDKALIEEYLPDYEHGNYEARVADNVAIGFNDEAYNADKIKFFKLWWRLFLQHPVTYLNAWTYTSYGLWYPDAVINVYKGHTVNTFTYDESSYFAYETEHPGTRESKIKIIDEYFRRLSLELTQQKIPVLSMLFSPGFLFWVYAFAVFFFLYIGQKMRALPYLLLFCVWLTFLLGPTYVFRYVAFFWFALPVLFADILRAGSDTK